MENPNGWCEIKHNLAGLNHNVATDRIDLIDVRLGWQFHIKHKLAKIPNVKRQLAVIFQDGDGVPKPFQRSRCKEGLCE